jgi:DNA-binding Lrp family transcriptional regulator
MNELDRLILEELQRDGRQDNRRLAARVGLTEAPCLRRVRRLVEGGVIDRFVAILRPQAIGLTFAAFVQVSLSMTTPEALKRFELAVAAIGHVTSCHRLLGDVDYLLQVVAADLVEFDRLYIEQIVTLPCVARTTTLVAVNAVKMTTELPLRS